MEITKKKKQKSFNNRLASSLEEIPIILLYFFEMGFKKV